MSRIDEELAKAVEESEAAAPAVAVPPAPARAASPQRNVGLLVALLVIGAAMLTLILVSGKNASVYAKPVEELVAEKDKYATRQVRVQGMLSKGTLLKRDEPCEFRFQIESKGATLPVRYAQCVPPDNFRDVPGMDVIVVAEGKLAENGAYFEASHIMAQCPSKYEMKQRAANGEKAPHLTMPTGIN